MLLPDQIFSMSKKNAKRSTRKCHKHDFSILNIRDLGVGERGAMDVANK